MDEKRAREDCQMVIWADYLRADFQLTLSLVLLQDRVWANVAKSLNCVIAMVDKLQEQDNNNRELIPDQQLADVITSHNPGKITCILKRNAGCCRYCWKGLAECFKGDSVEGPTFLCTIWLYCTTVARSNSAIRPRWSVTYRMELALYWPLFLKESTLNNQF
jgi:hypothetical protein